MGHVAPATQEGCKLKVTHHQGAAPGWAECDIYKCLIARGGVGVAHERESILSNVVT